MAEKKTIVKRRSKFIFWASIFFVVIMFVSVFAVIIFQ